MSESMAGEQSRKPFLQSFALCTPARAVIINKEQHVNRLIGWLLNSLSSIKSYCISAVGSLFYIAFSTYIAYISLIAG